MGVKKSLVSELKDMEKSVEKKIENKNFEHKSSELDL